MPEIANTTKLAGRFGDGTSAGYFEHEVSNWVRSRVRGGGPALPPLPVPDCPTILTVREVSRRVGFSRIHLWRLERAGKFPKRIRLVDTPDAAD